MNKKLITLFILWITCLSITSKADELKLREQANQQVFEKFYQDLVSLDMNKITSTLAHNIKHKGLMKMGPTIDTKEKFRNFWGKMIADVDKQKIDLLRISSIGDTVLTERMDTVWVDNKEVTFHLRAFRILCQPKELNI